MAERVAVAAIAPGDVISRDFGPAVSRIPMTRVKEVRRDTLDGATIVDVTGTLWFTVNYAVVTRWSEGER